MTLNKKDFLKEKEEHVREINNFFIICEKCGAKAIPVECRCLCDKMWCKGQRCGAEGTIDYFECHKCGWVSEQTEEGNNYEKHHLEE
jgi:hypothetical protein